jgi:hypothetical protein
VIGVLAGIAGCVRTVDTPSARPVSLNEELRAQMAPHDAVVWSRGRPLTWTDFLASPRMEGQVGARTGYGLFYAVRCVGKEFDFRVVAAFLPKQSWVKPNVVGDPSESRRVLGHEQTHFDLTEVYARGMREAFSGLPSACAKAESDLARVAEQFVREESQAQRKYDAETDHGLTLAEQVRWDEHVAERLASLRRYIQ